MSRTKGTFDFSNNFEVRARSPLDAKTRVETQSDLTGSTTWLSNTGDEWTYPGMIVSVWNDTVSSNNGIYRLKSSDYTNINNWEQIGGSSDMTSLSTAVSSEISNRTSDSLSLSTAISTVDGDVNIMSMNISTDISVETSNRVAYDDSLSTALSSEISDRVSADTSIVNSIEVNGATNGLSLSDKNIGLGGELSATTSINLNQYDFNIENYLEVFKYTQSFNGPIYNIKIQSDGKILVAGYFTSSFGITTNNIVRLNSDGTYDDTFITGYGFDNYTNVLAIQSDGKILVGGNFSTYNKHSSGYIVRLNSDGTYDDTFVNNSIYDEVYDIKIQSDGKILVGGLFQPYLIRLLSNGSNDPTLVYTTGFSSFVRAIEIQSDGKILVGGNFMNYNSITTHGLVRITTGGTYDAGVSTGFNQSPNVIKVQSDGNILVGGNFTTFNGSSSYKYFIRLTSALLVDGTFSMGTGFNNSVYSIMTQSDGKILVGGSFTSYNGTTSNDIIRLNTNGSIDTSFVIGSGFNTTVNTINLMSNDNILVGGWFTSYKGVSTPHIIMINSVGTKYNYDTINTLIYRDNLIEYAYDVSRYYTDRSLVDKSYVDTFPSEADNGISLSGTTIELGGQLNNVTSIDLNNNDLLFKFKNNSLVIGNGFNDTVNVVVEQSDSKILVGGSFTTYSGITTNYVTRLNTDGSIDNEFYVNFIINSYVNTIAIQSDGKILLGGSFTTNDSNYPCNYIVRLNSDGTFDTSFSIGSGFDSEVLIIKVQPDNKILVGGYFTSYDGTTSGCIIRLNSDGSVDSTFVTGSGFDSSPSSIIIQSDNKILVGGYFTSYDVTTSYYIIRLNSDGSVDSTFVTGSGFDDGISTMVMQSDNKILIGGYFTSYDGTTSNRIIRLDDSGATDNTFIIGDGFDNYIYTISIQLDGKILVGGYFTSYSGITSNYFIRLNIDGSTDNSFNIGTGFDDSPLTTIIQSDSKILVGGYFTSYDGTTSNRIIRLNIDGTIDSHPQYNIILNDNTINYTNDVSGYYTDRSLVDKGYVDNKNIVVSNGLTKTGNTVFLGGDLTELKTSLNVNTNEFSFVLSNIPFNTGTGFDGSVDTLVIQPDGKIIVGGYISNYNGTTIYNIARLNSDGTIDNTFITGTGFNNYVRSIYLQSDGKIVVVGDFGVYNGNSCDFIIRLNSDGSVDNTFTLGAYFGGTLGKVNVQSDGKIIVCGSITNYIIRLNSDGSVDTTFDVGSGFDSNVRDITIQPDGKILVGGDFTSYNGTTSNHIIRLDESGATDNTFDIGSGFDSTVTSISVQSDGKILVGGAYSSYNGTTSNYFIRLNIDGSIDNTFNIGDGFNGLVSSISIQSDSKILVGGYFTTYSGITSNYFIRLNIDGSTDNSFNIGTGFDNFVYTIGIQSNTKIIVGGQFTSCNGVTSNYLIRLNSDGSVDNGYSSNEIILKDNTVKYLYDYSIYYSERSLVDKGYVNNNFLKTDGGTLTGNLNGTSINLTDNIVSANVRKITPISLVSGTTTDWWISDSCSANLLLTGSTTLNIFNAVAGDTGTLLVIQYGSGTFTFPSGSMFVGGNIPTLTGSGGVDILSFYYNGVNYYWNVGKNYY